MNKQQLMGYEQLRKEIEKKLKKASRGNGHFTIKKEIRNQAQQEVMNIILQEIRNTPGIRHRSKHVVEKGKNYAVIQVVID